MSLHDTTFHRQSPKPTGPKVYKEPDLLISIMAHGAVKSTLQRHLPFICTGEDDVLVWSPENDKVVVEGKQAISLSLKGHDGRNALLRFRYILRHLAESPYKRHALFEYDSIALAGFPNIEEGTIAGIFFRENNPGPVFKASIFCHPPLYFHKSTVMRLADAFERIPLNEEDGMWDRALGRAIELAGVNHMDLHKNGLAFSHNTIHPEHYEAARTAARGGAKYYHGIKDAQALEVILKAIKE